MNPILDYKLNRIAQKIKAGIRDEEVITQATRIVSKKKGLGWSIKERDYLGELKAIYDWARKNVRFVNDPVGIEVFQTPKKTILRGAGDCDDYTILIGALAGAIGYPIRLKVIGQTQDGGYNHIYPLIGIPPNKPSVWIAMDASKDYGVGVEPSLQLRKYIYEIK